MPSSTFRSYSYCTFTAKAVKDAKSHNSSKRDAVRNISITHVNQLNVLSCSSIRSDWLSGYYSWIAICIKLSRFELSLQCYSFTTLQLYSYRSSILLLLSLYRSCLIEREWAFIARNARNVLFLVLEVRRGVSEHLRRNQRWNHDVSYLSYLRFRLSVAPCRWARATRSPRWRMRRSCPASQWLKSTTPPSPMR